MKVSTAIRKINTDELICPKCKSSIIDVMPEYVTCEPLKQEQFICRWCEHKWNER